MKQEQIEDMREKTIFVQVIEKPERKLLLKRGIKATHYFEYCEEVGCDVWGILVSVKEAPRFQLEPQGYRGYIEGRPVKAI